MKQVTVGQENITEDYLDALSEAGKQPTEYDLDLDATVEVGPSIEQDPGPRSEPWWQPNDEPMPNFQSSYGFATAPSGSAGRQDMDRSPQWGMEATLDPNVGKPFGIMDTSHHAPDHYDELLQLQQQQQQQAWEEQQILQMPMKHMDGAANRREPLHAWNSSSGADFRYNGGSQKMEFSGPNNGFLNAGNFNRDQQPYQQPMRNRNNQAGSMPLAPARVGADVSPVPRSPARTRRSSRLTVSSRVRTSPRRSRARSSRSSARTSSRRRWSP